MKIKFLLATYALCLAACASAGTDSSKPPSEELASETGRPVNASTGGLTKVGDLPDADGPYLAVQCSSQLSCWINTRTTLWKSVDGGKSWQEVHRAPDVDEVLRYVFVDAERGWSFYLDKVSTTHDGGRTWTPQASPFENSAGQIRSIWFLKDGKTGWLAGGLYRRQTSEELKYGVPNNAKDVTGKRVLQEAIFQTSDGGQTWKPAVLTPRLTGRIVQIRFSDETQGIALGELNTYYTSDGGTRWQPIVFDKKCVRRRHVDEYYDSSPDSVEMLNSGLFWLSYRDGRIVKSLDGGRHWCDLVHEGQIPFEEGSRRFLTAMHFDRAEHGWGLGADRFLYETMDAGLGWARVTSDSRFNGMTFPSIRNGYLISDKSIYSLSR